MVRTGRGVLVVTTSASLAVTCACVGPGADIAGAETLDVLMVGNPQMADLQKLTAEHFTKQTGIVVKFSTLPENEAREKINQEFSAQAGQYDVASISNFEVPFYAKNGWLEPLDDHVADTPGFDQRDILPPILASLTAADGKVYAEPFYGESSFLMYRQDVLTELGIQMPATPTWPEVAEIAARVDGARPGMRGICLRGRPGWGQVIAPLTTVVNTFGGTWFTEDWQARLTSPEFLEATEFYVDLVREHGESNAAKAGFAECADAMTNGRVAMWYDATSAAGQLEASGSPVRGQVTYVQAPIMRTKSSGWLYSWAWGVQKASRKGDSAWKFISWASSKEYEELVGRRLGWSKVPAGKRDSTYANPNYLEQAGAFAKPTELAIQSVDPLNPGVQARPTVGIQFVDVPEFAELATKVSELISAAIAGEMTVSEALARGQELAEQVAQKYRK